MLLHGTFDAVLLCVNFYEETAWENYSKDASSDRMPYNPVLVNMVAWTVLTMVMLAGVGWYFRENRRQRDRLKKLEEQEAARRGEGDSYGV